MKIFIVIFTVMALYYHTSNSMHALHDELCAYNESKLKEILSKNDIEHFSQTIQEIKNRKSGRGIIEFILSHSQGMIQFDLQKQLVTVDKTNRIGVKDPNVPSLIFTVSVFEKLLMQWGHSILVSKGTTSK